MVLIKNFLKKTVQVAASQKVVFKWERGLRFSSNTWSVSLLPSHWEEALGALSHHWLSYRIILLVYKWSLKIDDEMGFLGSLTVGARRNFVYHLIQSWMWKLRVHKVRRLKSTQPRDGRIGVRMGLLFSLLKQKIFLFLWNKTYIPSSDQWARLIFNR